MESSRSQLRISRALHRIGDATSRAGVAAAVAAAVLAFLLVLTAFGLPSAWQERFATLAAAITLVMVFVIQHTQSRQQAATQLKLDELIRAAPHADDHLVHIEAAEDDELIAREQSQIAHHASVRQP